MSSNGRRLWFGLTVAISIGCLGLSAWQFDRRGDRMAQNRLAVAGRSQPLLDLRETSGDGSRVQRRVVVRGTFDHAAEVILRGHLLTGAPGVHVVTPLRMTDRDSGVLVNRGFVPAADGATPDRPVPQEPGEVEITGIALELPRTEDGGAPVTGSSGTSWRRLDLDAMREALPYPLLEVYVLAEPDTSRRGWPRRVEPPPLGEGRHLSYALQWIGIAAAVLGFGLFVILGVGRRGGATVPPPPPPPPQAA